MSGEFRKVLVAVRDVEGGAGPLLRKAEALAARGASIELLHVMTGPVTIPFAGIRQARTAAARAVRSATEQARARLERLTRSRGRTSRSFTVHVTWDSPVGDAVVRRARRIRADLVVAGAQPPRFGGRLLLVNTDWELIRETPCPLLIVKPTGRYGRHPVLAAVDPFHANDKPARLDARVLEVALSIARALGSEAHVFHAYTPLAALLPTSLMQPVPIVVSRKEEISYTRQVRSTFDALARRAGIAASRRHLRAGDVAAQLASVVRDIRAQVVVMGALSRSGMKRVFIGNTAERVLDRLRCDLLVVKPRGFTSRVPRRARYAPRGALPPARS